MTTTIANSIGNKTYFIMHKARLNTPLVANNFKEATDYKFVPDPIGRPVVYYAGTRVYTAVVDAIPSHFILDANMEILYAERAEVFVHHQNLILGTKDQQHLFRARAACVDYASLNKLAASSSTTTSGVVPPPVSISTSTGKRKRNDIYDNNYDAQTDPIGATPAAKRVDAKTMAVFGDSVSYAFNPEARKIPETPFQFTGPATASSPRASPAFSSLYNTSRPQPPRTNTASLANTITTQGNEEDEDNEVNSSKKAIVCLFAAFLLIMVVTICIVMPVYCYYCFFFDFDGVEVEVGRGAGTGAGVGAGTEGFNTSDT